MNANARGIHLRDQQLRVLCLAIGIALAFPMMTLAQDVQSAPEETTAAAEETTTPEAAATSPSDSETSEDSSQDELFSIELSDYPEKLKELIQITNRVEIGANYVSDNSFRFGRYTGLHQQGLTALFNLDLFHRGAYDSGSAEYWKIQGTNLGLDSREAEIEVGVQGKYKIQIDYDQIPIFRSDSMSTPFIGAGSTDLTLPSNWVGSSTTAGMTQLLPDLNSFDLKTIRRQTGLGVSWVLSPYWGFSTSYKTEHKDGNKTIGATFGNSGGNPRAAIVPEPVDYTTQQFDAVLSYTTKKTQIQAAYYLSIFTDNNTSLTWSNPYTTISGWAAGTGFPSGRGQLSLPPDNQFHQFSLDGGYNFSDRTRFTASVARGRMTQNETFLPYTDIASLQASITQPLPRDSLDGSIDTTVINLRLASRPWQDFSWSASYRYDDRDNNTPRNEYVYIGGDSQNQDTSATSSKRRYNEPYSYTEEQYKIDATYRIFGNTDLSAGAQHSKIDRTYSEREQADEDTYNFGINTEISERFSGHLRYTFAQRDGSTYVGNEPLHTGYSEAYVATVTGDFENLPGLRKYYQANRDRDQVTATLSFTPTEAWTLGLEANYAQDEYNESELGLIDSKIDSYTFDTTYAPSPLWSTYLFYTTEKLTSDQDGHSFSGTASVKVAQANDPNRDWFVYHRDHINSYGAGYKRSLTSKPLDFGIDYTYSKTRSNLDFAVGSLLSTKPLPSDVSQLDSLNLYGTYAMRDNLSLRLNYLYERYHSTDWSVDGIAPNQLANVILLGEDSPDYNVHAVSLSMTYRF